MTYFPIPHPPPDGWSGPRKTDVDPTSAQSKPSLMATEEKVLQNVNGQQEDDFARRRKKAAKEARHKSTKTIQNTSCAADDKLQKLGSSEPEEGRAVELEAVPEGTLPG